MRIVAGRWRGRTIASPKDDAIRPTSDRLRETLFNIIAHRYRGALAGARVLDLFAGTGALGLEALTRGAAFAVFVDESADARGLIRENILTLGAAGTTRVFRRDATMLGTAAPNDPFDLVFCDPPYGKGLAEKALTSARDGGWLAPGALVIVEEAAEAAFAPPQDFALLDSRDQGITRLSILWFGSRESSINKTE
jgi:16S rRNA (guanine966-N2)-methyltransferase